MQKTLLLLPLLCLLCTAQDQDYTQTSNVGVVSNQSPYSCPNNYVYLVHDTQVFNDVVCVKTTIEQVSIEEGDCPPGMATVSYEEVAANTQKYCDLIGEWDIARIGFRGSLDGSGYDCKFRDFDSRDAGVSICVRRRIQDTKSVQVNGNLCGEGQTIVTEDEALANQDAYCNLLGQYDIVRLANGGSMDGNGYGCKIRYGDRRSLGNVLCRSITNNN